MTLQHQHLQTAHVDGRLRLRFARQPPDGHTTLALAEQQPPLRIVRAFHLEDGAALVHLHNLSGGVLGGDQLELVVEVGPRAHAQLTSTGATRIYRRRAGRPVAMQQVRLSVAADGLLEFVPDPLIPFANSAYRQDTRIDLAPGSGLFWWEIVAPGREARGEVFAFDLLQTRLDLVADGRLVALERARLEPHQRPPASLARLGPYRYYVTFYVCRVGATDDWPALEEQLRAVLQPWSCPGEIVWGVSSLPAHGLVVRALSRGGRAIMPGLMALWRAAKLALYGREPIPPRKVY